MNMNTLHNPRPAAALDAASAAELADIFRLLGDPSRLRIILACCDGPLCVGDIAERLDLAPSLVSHHLRLLRAARLVRGRRRGKEVHYRLADEHISCVIADMVEHVIEPPENC